MTDQLINFDTAKLAKEKGFTIDTALSMNSSGIIRHQYSSSVDGCKINWSRYDKSLRIPTQSLLQRWLREEHNILIQINCYLLNKSKNSMYSGIVYSKKGESILFQKETYEENLEYCLIEALKLI